MRMFKHSEGSHRREGKIQTLRKTLQIFRRPHQVICILNLSFMNFILNLHKIAIKVQKGNQARDKKSQKHIQ